MHGDGDQLSAELFRRLSEKSARKCSSGAISRWIAAREFPWITLLNYTDATLLIITQLTIVDGLALRQYAAIESPALPQLDDKLLSFGAV